MATTSSSATGTGGMYPHLIEMPLVSEHPKPDPAWEGSTKGGCTRCKAEVWMHETIRRALQEPKYLPLCSRCIKEERDRQAAS